MTNELVHLDSSIEEGLREFGIEIGLTAEELFDVGTHAMSTALYQAVRAGVAFMASKEALRLSSPTPSDSTITNWIASYGFTKQRFYECISLAKGYLAIPADQRKGYLALGKYKAIKLASIEPEVLADLALQDPGLLVECALMSRDQMAAQIASLKASLELEQGQVKRLQAAATKTRLTTFMPRTDEVREECLALGKGVEVHLNGLRMQFEEIAADHGDAEHRLRMEQVWVAAHLAAARALDLVGEMAAAWDAQDMPARILSQHCLTPEEAARWLHDAPLIESRADAEKLIREQKRATDQPRKPGRPKGAANKAG